MKKVVKRISTGEIVYRSKPDFEDGKGIENANILEGIDKSDLQEVIIEDSEWDSHKQDLRNKGKDIDNFNPIIKAVILMIWKWHRSTLPVPNTALELKQQLRNEIG